MNRKLVIAVVAVTAAVGAIIVGILFVYPSLTKASEPTAVQAAEGGEANLNGGPIYRLKERVLNLADKNARRYVKLGVAVELAVPEGWQRLAPEERRKRAGELESEVDARAAVLNDALTTIVTAKTAEDLANAAGKEVLREELRMRFNALLGRPEIVKVYLTDFLVQ